MEKTYHSDSQEEHDKIIAEMSNLYQFYPKEYSESKLAKESENFYTAMLLKGVENAVICGHCNEIISNIGSRSHGKRCPKCGRIIYLEYIKGQHITMFFDDIWENLTLKLARTPRRLDSYFLFEMQIPSRYNKGTMARDFLKKHKDKYDIVVSAGKLYFRFFYNNYRKTFKNDMTGKFVGVRHVSYDEAKLKMHHYEKAKHVKLYAGEVYPEYGDKKIPYPESITIDKDWKRTKNMSYFLNRAKIQHDSNGKAYSKIKVEQLTILYQLLLKFKDETIANTFVQIVSELDSLCMLPKMMFRWEGKGYTYNPTDKPAAPNVISELFGHHPDVYLYMDTVGKNAKKKSKKSNVDELKTLNLFGGGGLDINSIFGKILNLNDNTDNETKLEFLNSFKKTEDEKI